MHRVPLRKSIPRPTARRLSLYLRELTSRQEQGELTVNSKALGRTLGLTDAQVRKDLAIFGQFGHPGRGYTIAQLIESLRRIMGRDRDWRVCVVGAGNIGRALASYERFTSEGFTIAAIFDNDGSLGAHEVGGLSVLPMSKLAKTIASERIRLGIIAVPREAAQQVADALVAAGVEGILNFAPRRIDVREGIGIVSVDFTVALEQLAFQIATGESGEDGRHALPHGEAPTKH